MLDTFHACAIPMAETYPTAAAYHKRDNTTCDAACQQISGAAFINFLPASGFPMLLSELHRLDGLEAGT